MSDNSLWTNRPELVQIKPYSKTPSYYQHKAYDDKLAILVCQIKIWQPTSNQWFNIPSAKSCLTIRECESIEVTDSAKDLIGKAVVKFPRGTVVDLSFRQSAKVNTGDKKDKTDSKEELNKATNNADMMATPSAQYDDSKESTTSMAIGYDDKGLIDFNRSASEPALLSPNDVATGNRIEIRAGYAYSDTEFKQLNAADNGADSPLDVIFTGFITGISVNTPLELECSNMAHVLTTISTPNIPETSTLSIKDFLDDDGTYQLLKNTGLSLEEHCKNSEIYIAGATISDNLTVADVLDKWNDSGVICMMDTLPDGSAQLKIGYGYYAGQGGFELPNGDKKYITYNSGVNTVKLLQFDWDVANDKLSIKHADKKYLAVEAHGYYIDKDHDKEVTKHYKVTIRKRPDDDDGGWDTDEDQFQTVNKREPKGKKDTKHKDGTESSKLLQGHLTDRVNLDKYNVIKYYSPTPNIEQDQLIEEAKQYWGKYNPNGMSGSIEIFGDVYIKPTEIVGLIDVRQPEKNGYYYVESVNTTFGVNGFRRELKIPFKVGSYAGPVSIIK